jgi:RNA polymerase sigma-70 factor (ECF subfamily)
MRRLDDVPASGPDARVWLYATARRVTANQHRAARRRMGLVDRIVESRSQSIPARAVTDGPDAERVRAALKQLSERDREVLLLAEWEELTSAEAAAVMGCSEGSARGRLHRARKRFRAAYERLHPRAAIALDTTPSLARPALAQPAESLGRIDHA